MQLRWLALLVISPTLAFAEPSALELSVPAIKIPLELSVGLGASSQIGGGQNYTTPDNSIAPAGMVTLVWRLTHHWAVGAHAVVSRYKYSDEEIGNQEGYSDVYNVTTFDIALTAQYELGRFWIAPWLGRHLTITSAQMDTITCPPPTVIGSCTDSGGTATSSSNNEYTTVGLTVGADVLQLDGNRIAVFADAQTGFGATDLFAAVPSYNYTAIALGVAYRR